MKIGFNLLQWTTRLDDSLWPKLEAMKAAGYDGVEVPVFEGTPADYAAIRARLADMGLAATALGIVPDPARNPMSPDPVVRRAGEAHLAWLVDCAEALGAEVLVGPFYQPLATFSGAGPTPGEWRALVETQRSLALRAARAGIRVAVEPLNRFECYALNTAADAARLVAEVNVAGYGFLYDTFHANIEERDPVGALAAHLGAVTHVHLSENDRGTPGRGHVDFDATVATLVRGGYEGWLVFEAFGHALPGLSAATRVWRPLFASDDETWREGIDLARRALARARPVGH
jgi:D-psicose/D-tagatose/L-ribulose 3-epimerase